MCGFLMEINPEKRIRRKKYRKCFFHFVITFSSLVLTTCIYRYPNVNNPHPQLSHLQCKAAQE